MGTTLPPKKFNVKRPGALIGTITEAMDELKRLYATIGMLRAEGGNGPIEPLSEIRPYGACPACERKANHDLDPARMIAPELSLKNGAVLLWAGTYCGPVEMIKQLAKMLGIDEKKPLAEQNPGFVDILLYGYEQEPVSYVYKKKPATGFYRGCVNDLQYMRDAGTTSKGNLRAIAYFSGPVSCPDCGGTGLNRESLAVAINGMSVAEALSLPVPALLSFVQRLSDALCREEREAVGPVIEELESRLHYLKKIGLASLRWQDAK